MARLKAVESRLRQQRRRIQSSPPPPLCLPQEVRLLLSTEREAIDDDGVNNDGNAAAASRGARGEGRGRGCWKMDEETEESVQKDRGKIAQAGNNDFLASRL